MSVNFLKIKRKKHVISASFLVRPRKIWPVIERQLIDLFKPCFTVTNVNTQQTTNIAYSTTHRQFIFINVTSVTTQPKIRDGSQDT